MKAILKFALVAAATYALIKVALERAERMGGASQHGIDAANPPSSVDDIPTLKAVRDDDVNVAQNIPL